MDFLRIVATAAACGQGWPVTAPATPLRSSTAANVNPAKPALITAMQNGAEASVGITLVSIIAQARLSALVCCASTVTRLSNYPVI